MTTEGKKKPLHQHQGFLQQVLCASVGSVFGTVVGTGLGFSAVGLTSFEQDENAPFVMANAEKSVFNSLLILSMMVGSIAGHYMSSMAGPRMNITLLLMPMIASWVLLAFSKSLTLFFVSRAILGICGGVAMPIGQIYLSEIASPETRGFISSTSMLSQYMTMLTVSVAAIFLPWRDLALLSAALMLALLLVSFAIPESPTWLLRRDAKEEAIKALQFVRGEENVKPELGDLQKLIKDSKLHSSGRFLDILRGNSLKPMAVLISFTILRQFTGAFAVASYTAEIFETAGSGLSGITCTVIINLIQLCFNFLSNGLTDRLGRKKLYVTSASLMCIANLSFGTYFHFLQKNPTAMKSFNWVPLVCLIIYSIGFSVGFASSLYTLMTELIPMRIRGSASATISVLNHFFCYIIIQTFYNMELEMTEAGTFWFYGVICIAAAVFCKVILPETNGKTLAELETMLDKKKASKLNAADDDSKTSETNVDEDIENATDLAIKNTTEVKIRNLDEVGLEGLEDGDGAHEDDGMKKI
ncbi:unnamed protein product [Notodromas monacha]|uniref:Major facilitator superfamily (MFS) profile domain-containing protein n=1 Tax=Notodromas monacha TaxID=399045 RepID=A0A7R9BRK8_9CRUS|nr:unnamed protein product [Notodromas monacha]CAG0920404.1 unnamed protein product [Notodromas monacha]